MHTVHRLAASLALAIAAVVSLAACAPKDVNELTFKVLVHGVVTDAKTAAPLAGVKVTLHSTAVYAPVTTADDGYFAFANLPQGQNVLVTFTLAGYGAQTVSIKTVQVSADGGPIAVDGFDASTTLTALTPPGTGGPGGDPQVTVPVSGLVYDGVLPANGVQVMLVTPTSTSGGSTIAYSTTSTADGRFSFPAVHAAFYALIVLPWDRDHDGTTDTQFFSRNIDLTPGTGVNLGNVTVVLQDVQRALVASSFTNLTKPYPVSTTDLVTGVSGVLPAPGNKLFLHFGAEVDPLLTSFELVPVEKNTGTRFGLPIGLTVAWDHASIANLTTATALVPSDDLTLGYELRIRALRFKDGDVGINPSGNSFGAVDFTVLALPVPLTSIQPALYLANQATATQVAAKFTVDQNNIWLFDATNDFVFDTDPTASYSAGTGLQLSWTHEANATRYRVLARNTVSAGGNAVDTLAWRELAVVSAPDPNQNPLVVANVNPWTGGLGSTFGPWSYNNHVLFTVIAEDALGFRSSIDAAKVLDTADTFPGLLTSATVDPGGLPFPFAITTERGSSFTKTIRVTFSEPMATTAAPTIASQSANLTLGKILTAAWGTSNTAPSATPLNTSSIAFVSAQLSVKGACTELMLDRSVGDVIVPVRDTAPFAVGANRLVLLDRNSGAFMGESLGISAVDPASSRLTLSSALVPTSTPVGSLVCALQAPATGLTNFVSTSGITITVGDPSAYYFGENILVYEPQTIGVPQISDVRRVSGIDTVAKIIQITVPLTAGHTTASVVLPVNVLAGEVALRTSQSLTLSKDSLAGGANTELFLAGPANVLVGDVLLVDADGDLKTTNDQTLTPIRQVKFAPTAAPFPYSLIVDLPTGTLLHGKATVLGMGDSFQVGGTKDTTGAGVKPLDPHRDQFTADGVLF